MVAPAPISEIAKMLKEIYPDRVFDEIEDGGTNECINAEADRVEDLLREAYGQGYTSLKESIRANAQDLI